MRKLAALSGALLLTLVLAAPAAAKGTPEKHVDETHYGPDVLYSCAEVFPGDPAFDFDVMLIEDQITRATWWVDEDGLPLEITAHHDGTKTVYAAPRPGYKLSGPFKYTSHIEIVNYDPVRYYEHSTGTYWNLHTPKGGTAFHEAGLWSTLIEWDDFGPFFLDIFKVTGVGHFDGEAVCEALAG